MEESTATAHTSLIYARAHIDDAMAALEVETPTTSAQPWRLPVGNEDHPSSEWYVYTWHDLTGRRNSHINNYQHTGLDINGNWRNPETGELRGNVDIGEPVFAVTGGEIVDVGWSERFRGGFVLKVDHFGIPLYIRYWHLHLRGLQSLEIGNQIYLGRQMGKIDEYPSGYAHLHLDMAWQPFRVHWWHTSHPEIEWANPAWILKTHIDPVEVDAMLASG